MYNKRKPKVQIFGNLGMEISYGEIVSDEFWVGQD